MTLGIQLCDGGTKVQLCDGGTKVQLCEQVEPVPQECPEGLNDEYDVTVCGHTVTVTRVAPDVCEWEWTSAGLEGCNMTIDYISVSLLPDEFPPRWRVVALDTLNQDACHHDKYTGGDPLGLYDDLTTIVGNAHCGTSALVEETAP